MKVIHIEYANASIEHKINEIVNGTSYIIAQLKWIITKDE